MISLCYTASCAVLLDDTWADNTRNNQNLPTDSAWFASTGSALTAANNAMTLSLGSSAVLGVTYFTASATSPVQLQIGETLQVSATMSFNGLTTPNNSEGFRVGIFNFADSTLSPKRVTADGMSSSSQGNGVQGYALFQNMGTAFNNASPIDIRRRTTVSDSSLLGTSSDYTILAFGPGNTNTFSGFANGTTYVLTMSLQRTSAVGMEVSVNWLNVGSGASLAASYTDAGVTNFSFDGIAFRPQSAATTATTINFTELKVELIGSSTPPSINTQPADQNVFVNQNASFSVAASGSSPLAYQWFYNSDTALTGATNSSLLLTNVSTDDAGDYQVVITNAYGAVTSSPATLSVIVPEPPSITSQPSSQTVSVGQNVTLALAADGTQPLSYQWFSSATGLLGSRTNASLTFTNIQVSDTADYSVLVTNIAGSVTSVLAHVWVSNTPLPPSFTLQPASLIVVTGATSTFTAAATGTAPLSYQWSKDGTNVSGATGASLSITNVQLSAAGSYTLAVSNVAGTITSQPVLLTVSIASANGNSAFNLTGFGRLTTGGGVVLESNAAAYKKVYNAIDLSVALADKNNVVKVIEIMNDLDLGFNEVPAAAKTNSLWRSHNLPQIHPVLLQTGVSLLDIQKKSGLTIFSANGSTIRHATLNIKNSGNVIVRNLKFDQMWEWDEATKGQYDKNDWDFIDLGNSGTVSNIWVDHCTFTKAYDGITDIKDGSYNITFSWCKYTGDDGATNPNSWVRQQFNALETNRSSYAMYNFLRNNGFSLEDIVTICQGHDKTHLIGATTAAINSQHSVTFHHDWFINPWDRLPRLRGGNIHNYDIYVDDTLGLAARRLRDARAAAMSAANQNTLNNTYNFRPFLNGTISTEGGAILVEKSVYIDCITPLRNNQTDPSNPTYTGKIMATDTVYQMDDTYVRGNSTDPGNPLGPFQAPTIPFSWNLPNNALPYTYTMDDPSLLAGIVTDPNSGAGAGVLTWNKTNWLVTSYAASAPQITGQPFAETRSTGQTASFVVVAGGTGPLSYQWYFNTNSLIAGATNSTLNISNVQPSAAGKYSVVVTNSLGSVTSSIVSLNVTAPAAGFASWQSTRFTSQQLADPNISGPDATPAGDGVANFVKYALALEPFVTAPKPLVGYRLANGLPILTYQRPLNAPDATYVASVSTDLATWSTVGVVQQQVGVSNSVAFWEASYSGSPNVTRFMRLQIQR
jgi:pectate lyase